MVNETGYALPLWGSQQSVEREYLKPWEWMNFPEGEERKVLECQHRQGWESGSHTGRASCLSRIMEGHLVHLLCYLLR